jgi:hypothetical protein
MDSRPGRDDAVARHRGALPWGLVVLLLAACDEVALEPSRRVDAVSLFQAGSV